MPWAVAAAVIGAGGAVYSADKQSKAAKAGKNSDPAYVEAAKYNALDRAQKISEREYKPYTGQRVANISANEREASQLARTGNQKGLGYLDKAGAELGKMTEFSGDNVTKYMNPYLDTVLQPQLREANRGYERERSRLANSKGAAKGGDRMAFAESELERSHADNVSGITGRTYAAGFDAARTAFFQDQDRHMRAGQAYQALGGDVSRMNREQIQDLMATGGVERILAQADLDFDYQTYVEARDWDANNLQPLLNAIAASKGGNMAYDDSGKSDPWGQAIGAAATIAGMYFTGNMGSQRTTSTTSSSGPPGWIG